MVNYILQLMYQIHLQRILVIAFRKDMNMHIQLHKLITTCGRWREENLRSAKR
jgi:hypothetical protein